MKTGRAGLEVGSDDRLKSLPVSNQHAAVGVDGGGLPRRLDAASTSATVEDVSAFDVMMRVISDRVVLTAIECPVAALWVLSTYVYDRFPYAPQ